MSVNIHKQKDYKFRLTQSCGSQNEGPLFLIA